MDGEFEIRNRHGDLIQRGGVEIERAERGLIDVRNVDAVPMKDGDTYSSSVYIPADVWHEAFGGE